MTEPVFTPATDIRIGDKIAYEGRPHARVLRNAEPYTDQFGRTLQAFWCGSDDESGREGWVPFGPGGGFPVIKAAAAGTPEDTGCKCTGWDGCPNPSACGTPQGCHCGA
jgi:hypothetical protein